MRKPIFVNNFFYHLFNKGIEGRKVFLDEFDYQRFLESLLEFNCPENVKISWVRQNNLKQVKPVKGPPLVLLCCYCLMPNHFHLLVKQLVKDGISKFIQKLATGYTMYFNKRYGREGRLFQSSFKAIRVETDEQLIHLSRYIHLNPIKDELRDKREGLKQPLLRKKLQSYSWSSYPEFIGFKKNICNGQGEILPMFKSSFADKPQFSYQQFVESYAFGDELLISDLILDD